MKYFLHDSNAFQDEKITELFINFGYEGIGLFFTILEKLALQEMPVRTEVLKKQLFIGKRLEKCWKFLEQIELISSNNGETFNKQLINFAGKYKIKKEKNAERISKWRKNQDNKENVTRYETITEHVCNTPKVKRSKENIIYPTPDEINIYCISKGYKVDYKKIHDYYSQNDWKDSRGKKVLCWKSKILSVWCKEENKINGQKIESKLGY